MFFLDKYITGTGLNFTNLYNNKVSKVKNYSIQLIPKYNFVICEFEELQHTESELTNYAHSIKLGGYLIIRKKYTHEECYNEIYFYNPVVCTCNYTNDKKMNELKKLSKVIDLGSLSDNDCNLLYDKLSKIYNINKNKEFL